MHIVQDIGWSRKVVLAACNDIYCQGLAQDVKATLAK
eukprot:COSAG05_NODE_6365_length_973_cov_1.456522_2_plen_36_part_01